MGVHLVAGVVLVWRAGAHLLCAGRPGSAGVI